MHIACICCTYKRPTELANVIECFLRQDYPADKRELIVLDDAGQYGHLRGDGWEIVSMPVRFRTLGEKRNASAGLVSPDVDAYAVWDDDDVYLPWHLSASVAALKGHDYTIPTRLWTYGANQRLKRKENQYLYHGGWSFTREAFRRADGYPFMQSGQDQGLLKRFKRLGLRRGNPLKHDNRPSYVYRWFDRSGAYHISSGPKHSYERLGEHHADPVINFAPGWERDWLYLYELAKHEEASR